MTSIIKRSYGIFALFILCLFSCKDDLKPIIHESRLYLHLSHTRTASNPFMGDVVDSLDYSKFDMLWLGGDLAQFTSADDMTMNHVDSIFDLGNTNTLWALGNHDYTDLNRVEQYTGRAPYYTMNQDGITFVVLDTQDNFSNIVDDQKDFLIGILDTIQESSHLIILHHKLIWMYDNIDLEAQIVDIPNADLGNYFHSINPNNFNSEIYPRLVEIKEKGTEVLCIGGDIGIRTDEFEYLSPEGIHFLASGINYVAGGNKALLFHHDLIDHRLTWDFILLSSLEKK